MNKPALEPVARRAIAWMVRMESGAASDAERQAFDVWCGADARHAAAWARLKSAQQVIREPLARGLSPRQVQALIPPAEAPAVDRRTVLRAGLGVGALAIGAALANRFVALDELTADFSTATGVRRTVDLAGGDRLVLNARSAVDIRAEPAHDALRLRNGLIYFDKRAGTGRGAVLASRWGSVMLDDGACNFFADESMCRIDVSRGSARFIEGDNTRVLDAGDSLMRDATGMRRFATDPGAALAWLDGRLVVHDEPLSEVVRMLRPYWTGILRLDERVAGLRVTGTYPLADTWRTITSLAATLPIRASRQAGYWIAIGGAI